MVGTDAGAAPTFVNPNLDVVYSEAWIAVDASTPGDPRDPRRPGRALLHRADRRRVGRDHPQHQRAQLPRPPHGRYAICLAGSSPEIPEECLRVDIPSSKAKLLTRVELGDDVDRRRRAATPVRPGLDGYAGHPGPGRDPGLRQRPPARRVGLRAGQPRRGPRPRGRLREGSGAPTPGAADRRLVRRGPQPDDRARRDRARERHPGVPALRRQLRQRHQRLVVHGGLPELRRRLLVPGHRELRRHLVELVEGGRLRAPPRRRRGCAHHRRHDVPDDLRGRRPPLPRRRQLLVAHRLRQARLHAGPEPGRPLLRRVRVHAGDHGRRLAHPDVRRRASVRRPGEQLAADTPGKAFTADLRLYLPRDQVRTGAWVPPALVPVDQGPVP